MSRNRLTHPLLLRFFRVCDTRAMPRLRTYFTLHANKNFLPLNLIFGLLLLIRRCFLIQIRTVSVFVITPHLSRPFLSRTASFLLRFGRANITSNAVSGYLFDVVFLNSWFDRRIHNPSFYFTLSLLRNSRRMVITRARVQVTRIPLPLLLQSWAHHQWLRLRR